MVSVITKADTLIKEKKLTQNSNSVSEAVKRYADKKNRKIFGKEIKKDAKKAGDYLFAFGIINKFYGLTPEQEQCFKYIKRWDKN